MFPLSKGYVAVCRMKASRLRTAAKTPSCALQELLSHPFLRPTAAGAADCLVGVTKDQLKRLLIQVLHKSSALTNIHTLHVCPQADPLQHLL